MRPRSARKTVFVHIGPPKTGTTYLQGAMWANRDVLCDHGILLPGERQLDHYRAGGDLCGFEVVEGGQPPTGAWDRLVAQVEQSDLPVAVISDERLSDATAEQAASALASLSSHDVHIIYGMRELAGALISSWQQHLRELAQPPVNVWIDELADGRHSWIWQSHEPESVLSRWNVAADHVHILIAPPPSVGRDALWARLASIIGAPAELPNEPPRGNESMGLDEAALLREVHERVEGGPPPLKVQRVMRNIVGRQTLSRRSDVRPVRLLETRRAWVDAQCDARQRFLVAGGFDIVGELHDLVPVGDRFEAEPATEADRARMLDAGMDVIAALVEQLALLRERYAREVEQVEHPHAATRPSPSPSPSRPTAHTIIDRGRPIVARGLRASRSLRRRARAALPVNGAQRTYYLHVGGGASGSAQLRHLLWCHRDALMADGVYLPGRAPADHRAAAADIRDAPEAANASGDSETGAWERLIRDAERSGYPKVMITADLAPATVEQIRTVMSRLAGAEVHVVYTVQELSETLGSAWRQRLESFPTARWDVWLDRVAAGTDIPWFHRMHDVGQFCRRWRAGGASNLHMLVVPTRGDRGEELWRRLRSIAGCSAHHDLDVLGPPASFGFSQAELLRRVQTRLRGRARPVRRSQVTTDLIAGSLLPALGRADEPQLPERLREWIEAETERRREQVADQANRVVGDLHELDVNVSRFGSPVAAARPDARVMLDTATAVIARLVETVANEQVPIRLEIERSEDLLRKHPERALGPSQQATDKPLETPPGPTGPSLGCGDMPSVEDGPSTATRSMPAPAAAPPPPPSGHPTVAVMTMARDEGTMLPRWIAHYGREVGVENLIVFDDNSQDGSTDNLPCTVHRLPQLPTKDFDGAKMKLCSGLARGLLAWYDAVILVDTDEFLIPDPARYSGILDYLASKPDRSVFAPVALNVVHHTAVEGPLDAQQPVLGQRRFAKFMPLMCKPSIKRIPAPWAAAAHGIEAPYEIDPELFMLHLKFYDHDALQAVGDRRRKVFEADGRAPLSSWTLTGDELTHQLDEFVAGVDPGVVPEFDPQGRDLAEFVVARWEGKIYRAVPWRQLKAMRREPLVRIPERLLGIL